MLTLSICFFILAYGVDCSTHGLALLLLSTIGAAFGLSISGFLTSLLSLAPNYIGVVSSVSQIIGTSSTLFTSPLFYASVNSKLAFCRIRRSCCNTANYYILQNSREFYHFMTVSKQLIKYAELCTCRYIRCKS